ncbi:MAG: hypothetical protein ACRC14_19805 [Paracoccaceae bacterium]
MSLFSLLTDILFVGHSLVGPNLPPLLAATLRAMNEEVTVEAQVINGASLAYNWDHSTEAQGVDARARLATGKPDVLILTEASPLIQHVEWSRTAELAAQWAALGTQTNPETRVYLYETWPSLLSGTATPPDGDPAGTLPWRDRITADLILWEDTAARASATTKVGLIPTGQALGLLSDEIEAGRIPDLTSIQDLFTDDIHPNDRGLYFLAMVHAAAITGRSPEGLPAKLTRAWTSREAMMSDDLALALQRVAFAAVVAEAARSPELLPEPEVTPTPTLEPVAIVQPAAEAPTLEPVAPETPALTPITNPNLGLGLAAVNDWSVQQPFLDVMKTARPWVGHLPGQWGGWDHDRLAAAGILDANGWPKLIPPDLTGISTLILTDLAPEATAAAGRYVLTHEGKGTLTLEGRASIVTTDPGRITFDYTPGDGAVLLTLKTSDPADPLRRITIVREDRATALAAGEIFNPDWIARIRGVKLIRLMDWMGATNATLTTPDQRPRPDDYTWARHGVPMEIQIALANALQADPWFSIPHTADDALIRDWATLARDTLDPTLNAHVEFSNEVWNWQFTQAQWAEDQGRARWGQDQTWVQFYALRAAQVMNIWTEIYADDAPERLTRIIATQTGWLGLEEQILDAPLVTAEGLPPPVDSFDAYAVTGYFSALLGSDPKIPLVKDWLTQSAAATEAAITEQSLTGAEADAYRAKHKYDLAFTYAAQELRDGSQSGDPTDSLATVLGQILPYHAAIAADRGLDLMMYEGGTHVVAYGAAVDDTELTDFFTALNYSPEMGTLYTELQQGWAVVSNAPFNAFVDVTRPIKWGSWGALRHLTDDNPRWQSLAKGCPQC